jgi:hypothetical protein
LVVSDCFHHLHYPNDDVGESDLYHNILLQKQGEADLLQALHLYGQTARRTLSMGLSISNKILTGVMNKEEVFYSIDVHHHSKYMALLDSPQSTKMGKIMLRGIYLIRQHYRKAICWILEGSLVKTQQLKDL